MISTRSKHALSAKAKPSLGHGSMEFPLDGLPFPPRFDARAIMSPRRPTLTISLLVIAAHAARPSR